jgi:hypothetical protein
MSETKMKLMNQETNSRGNPAWKKGGASPNPKGRPWESRNRLHDSVVATVVELWDAGGKESLAQLMVDDPATYHKLTFGLLPKEAKLTVEQRIPGNLSPDEWAAVTLAMNAIQRAGAAGVSPEVIGEWIETDLRARLATPLVELEVLPPPCPVDLPSGTQIRD